MKKILLSLVLVLALSSCAEKKKIDGVTYKPYGWLNEASCKNDSIQYEISSGSIIVAIIFSETIIVPVYTIGWDLYEPQGKINSKEKGVVK